MAEFRMVMGASESLPFQDGDTQRYTIVPSDTLGLSPSALSQSTLARAFVDDMALSGDVTPARLLFFIEALALAEQRITQLGKNQPETLSLLDTQTQSHSFIRTLTESLGVSDKAAKLLALPFLEGMSIAETGKSDSPWKNVFDRLSLSGSVSMEPDSPMMVSLYSLLPEIYHIMDKDKELAKFLAGFQKELGSVYRDEKGLRVIQSINETPAKYLKYIARSLGWQLQSKGAAEQRNECASIVDYYDLKGTPYGIRLLCNLTLDRLFKRLIELYTPSTSSSSAIIVEDPDADLVSLLNSEGDFVDEAWNDGAYTYHYDPLYSYVVYMRVDPDKYTYGEVRPRIKAFKRLIHTMHPAGRYCYPYIVCRGTRTAHYKQIQLLYEEITGLKTYDDLGTFDDGGRFDEADEPIDQSVSTKFYKDWKTFDDAGNLDDEGFFDDGFWEVEGIFEIN